MRLYRGRDTCFLQCDSTGIRTYLKISLYLRDMEHLFLALLERLWNARDAVVCDGRGFCLSWCSLLRQRPPVVRRMTRKYF